MPSIAIITDTNASLPPDVAAQHGIRQVPTTVHFGEEVFETGFAEVVATERQEHYGFDVLFKVADLAKEVICIN